MTVTTESPRDAYTSEGTTPEVSPMLLDSTLPLRFWAKVYAAPSGCWLWRGARTSTGYGNFALWKEGRWVKPHRYAYEQMVGPVGEGLVLDHLCRTPLCVYPLHLEPVTQRENVRRGRGHGSETKCPKGHPYSEENTIIELRGDGSFRCRRCHSCLVASSYQQNNVCGVTS